MRKRFPAALLALTILICALFAVSASAGTSDSDTAVITIRNMSGKSDVITKKVGEEFTVEAYLDVSEVSENGRIQAVEGYINYTATSLRLMVSDPDYYEEEMFPELDSKGGLVSNIDIPGEINFNASTAKIQKGYVFDSASCLLIRVTFKVTAGGKAEVVSTLDTMAAANRDLTPLVSEGIELYPISLFETVITREDNSTAVPSGGSTSVTESSEPVFIGLCGDADGDKIVTVIDATFIQRYLAYLITKDAIHLDLCDVDGDKAVTVVDATYIQRYLANIKIAYPIGEKLYR